jgi:hypothetical protein
VSAYPSRLSPEGAGGYWLTAFVARGLLVELVLREPAYRRRMMAEIEPEHWIVPRLRSGQSFKEPLQSAPIKTMGVIKPCAPQRLEARSNRRVIQMSGGHKPGFTLPRASISPSIDA